MHCHFLLQIVQANCSILPDGLCTHSHIPTLHRVYSHGHPELSKRVSAHMVGLWGVPGRKSEAESQDFPTPHSPAQLRSPSRFHQHHSRIPVPCLAPHQVPGNQVRYGSQETQEDSPAGFGVLWPRLSPQVKGLPPKAWANCLPIRIPGPSRCLNPEVPVNWGQGGCPVPSCCPLPALHIWPRRRSSERMEGMSAALSAQPPPPPHCTDEETMGP